LDLHPDWVVLQLDMANVFNIVLKGFIFQELHVASGDIIQCIPFVHAFYTFESPLFYTHHNHESNIMVIQSTMEICQGDPLGGALFALVHFKIICFSHFPSCLFPFIAYDNHIISPPLNYIICI
jgi:hypothetical protein